MPVKVNWIDTNKQVEANPKNISRLAAKDFKRHNDPGFFSSTSPAEMLRYIVSRAAKANQERRESGTSWQTALHAPSTSSVFVELCEQERGSENEGMCGELSVSMYGTRSAAGS